MQARHFGLTLTESIFQFRKILKVQHSRTRRSNLSYSVVGDGEPVVLLHGLGSQGRDWAPQIDALKEHYQVITMDCRGHGESPASQQALSMSDLAADVNEVLQELKIEAANIIGFSLGGMMAFQFAVEFPAKTHSLIVINSGPGPVTPSKHARRIVAFRKLVIRIFGLQFLAKLLARNLFPNESQKPLVGAFLQSISLVDKQTYLSILGAIRDFDVSARLSQIICPVLVITADQDYTPVSSKRAYSEKLADSRLIVIENSRHATPLDQPEVSNQIMLRFLNEVSYLGGG